MSQNDSHKHWTLGWLEPTLGVPHTELRTFHHQLFRGGRSSPFRFAERDLEYQRAYQPGDPIKSIDWRAKARTQKLYVRQATQTQHAHFNFVLDASKTMQFPDWSSEDSTAREGAHVTKFEFALRTALHLAYAACQQGDIFHFYLFVPTKLIDNEKHLCIEIPIPTLQKIRGLWSLLHASPSSSWTQTLIEFGKPARFKNTRGGCTLFFSDLLSFGSYCAEQVFVNQNTNLTFIHCLHSLERNPERLPSSSLFELKHTRETEQRSYLRRDLLSESKLSETRDAWVDTLRNTAHQHSNHFIEACENTEISEIYRKISVFSGAA